MYMYPPSAQPYEHPVEARAGEGRHVCARVCASAVPPHTTGPRRIAAPAERFRHSARRRAGSGSYLVQRGDTRGVPRADVGVECRRRVERLRAEAARGRRRRAWVRTV